MYKKETKTYTHNSPAVHTYCINVAIIIMQKNIYLFNVTLAEFYRHGCRISESSLVSLTTNMLAVFVFRQLLKTSLRTAAGA